MITRCDVCTTGNRVDRVIRYHADLNGELVVVENVPATVCDNCGETTFSPEVVDRLQKTILGPRRDQAAASVRTVEARVYDLVA